MWWYVCLPFVLRHSWWSWGIVKLIYLYHIRLVWILWTGHLSYPPCDVRISVENVLRVGWNTPVLLVGWRLASPPTSGWPVIDNDIDTHTEEMYTVCYCLMMMMMNNDDIYIYLYIIKSIKIDTHRITFMWFNYIIFTNKSSMSNHYWPWGRKSWPSALLGRSRKNVRKKKKKTPSSEFLCRPNRWAWQFSLSLLLIFCWLRTRCKSSFLSKGFLCTPKKRVEYECLKGRNFD